MIETCPIPNEQARSYLTSLPARPPAWQREVSEMRRDMREQSLARCGAPEPWPLSRK